MACKADVPFNFAAVSELDATVFGAARPGAMSQRCFNEHDKVSVSEVKEWCEFMVGRGIQRVVSLLSESEKGTYDAPLRASLEEAGLALTEIDPKTSDAMQQAVKALEAAHEAGQKVVVHCWGGGGRTGLFIAAWLVSHHGKSPEDAAALVEAHAKAKGASRRVDIEALRHVMWACPLA